VKRLSSAAAFRVSAVSRRWAALSGRCVNGSRKPAQGQTKRSVATSCCRVPTPAIFANIHHRFLFDPSPIFRLYLRHQRIIDLGADGMRLGNPAWGRRDPPSKPMRRYACVPNPETETIVRFLLYQPYRYPMIRSSRSPSLCQISRWICHCRGRGVVPGNLCHYACLSISALPPTINYGLRDPTIPLDVVPRVARDVRMPRLSTGSALAPRKRHGSWPGSHDP
jgi:hypothetical protein